MMSLLRETEKKEDKEWIMSSFLCTTFCSVENVDVWIAEEGILCLLNVCAELGKCLA